MICKGLAIGARDWQLTHTFSVCTCEHSVGTCEQFEDLKNSADSPIRHGQQHGRTTATCIRDKKSSDFYFLGVMREYKVNDRREIGWEKWG